MGEDLKQRIWGGRFWRPVIRPIGTLAFLGVAMAGGTRDMVADGATCGGPNGTTSLNGLDCQAGHLWICAGQDDWEPLEEGCS
jgi:hypothetical protein